MRRRKSAKPSPWHEEAYHAASRCQAASLPLTTRRLHGLEQPCQVEGQKTGRCFASLGSSSGMFSAGSGKDGRLIALFFEPHGIDHPGPDIGQGAHRDGMAFAFPALALIVLQGPRFGERRLPGKLLQGIATV